LPVLSKDYELRIEAQARTKVVLKHNLSRYESSIKIIPIHSSYLWGFEVAGYDACLWWLREGIAQMMT
jgi:hypothetical protein